MKAHLLHNGNLKITVDAEERKLLRQTRHEDPDHFQSDVFMHDWFEGFIGNSEYDWARPEYCGALTDAPMLAIFGEETQVPEGVDTSMIAHTGYWEGSHWYNPVEKCWGFMDYQVISVQEQLLEHGYAVFTSGNDGPAIEMQLMSDEILRAYIPTGQPGINSVFGDTPIRGVDVWADHGGIMLTGISNARGVHLAKHLGISAECMDNLCTVWKQFRQRQGK